MNSTTKSIQSAYREWSPVYMLMSNLNRHDLGCLSYQEAVRIIGQYPEILDITDDDIKSLDFANAPGSGIFLSALLNETELECLDGVFKCDYLGHRLGKNKAIVARKGSEVNYLGPLSSGQIVNFGKAGTVGYKMRSGVVINAGTAHSVGYQSTGGIRINLLDANYVGNESRDGLDVNFGNISDRLAPDASGGVRLNLGKTDKFASHVSGGLDVNFGEAFEFAYSPSGGVQINKGNVRADHSNSKEKISQTAEMLDALMCKTEEIEALRTLATNPDELLAFTRSYDWQAFYREVDNLFARIQDAARRCKGDVK